MPLQPVYDGIVAHAGGSQTNATPLNEGMNRVTTVAAAGDSVQLPRNAFGMVVYVVNDAAVNSMNVFPYVGERITPLPINTGFPIPAGKAGVFFCSGPGRWHSILTA